MTVDRDQALDAIDPEAWWVSRVGPQGRNRQWSCPNTLHGQTGATPPVVLSDARRWYCHGCGAGGSLIDAEMHLSGSSVAEAIAALGAWAGVADDGRGVSSGHPPRRPTPRAPVPDPLPDPDVARLPPDESDHVVAQYLAWRTWRPEAAQVFGLYGVTTSAGPAVRHPFRSAGEVLWWQDRTGGSPKWLGPKGQRRMPHAIDLHRSLETAPTLGHQPVVVVVEGPADVISLWHAMPEACVIGIPGGTGAAHWAPLFTDSWVLIATDADATGDKAAAELAPAIHQHGGRSVRVRPPDGLDITDWRALVGDEDALVADFEERADQPWWTEPRQAAA